MDSAVSCVLSDRMILILICSFHYYEKLRYTLAYRNYSVNSNELLKHNQTRYNHWGYARQHVTSKVYSVPLLYDVWNNKRSPFKTHFFRIECGHNVSLFQLNVLRVPTPLEGYVCLVQEAPTRRTPVRRRVQGALSAHLPSQRELWTQQAARVSIQGAVSNVCYLEIYCYYIRCYCSPDLYLFYGVPIWIIVPEPHWGSTINSPCDGLVFDRCVCRTGGDVWECVPASWLRTRRWNPGNDHVRGRLQD